MGFRCFKLFPQTRSYRLRISHQLISAHRTPHFSNPQKFYNRFVTFEPLFGN